MLESELSELLKDKENETVEFKECRSSINSTTLLEYCVALGNEGGGRLVLGVTNARPRVVVGTTACADVEAKKHDLLCKLHFRVDIDELSVNGKRVLVFNVPPRPLGVPLHLDGRYLMRAGESLVPMTSDKLASIYAEGGSDFSLQLCDAASLSDLDPVAIKVFRGRWAQKSQNRQIETMLDGQLLEDAELAVDGRLTYAALILLGTTKALGRLLPEAEVVFEYRHADDQIESSQRLEFRRGFLSFHDELWGAISARNDVQSVRDGMFRRDVPAFNEDAVREAVLNAVCHRDYRVAGSVFILQFPRKLQVSSPGGFPRGVTAENVLVRQVPRNRRLAEACNKCGLVERSGQGMDRIYVSALSEGKSKPEFTGTDDFQVVLTMHGEVIDARFLRLLDLAQQHSIRLKVGHLVILDSIRHHQKLTDEMEREVDYLVSIGLVERVGRGRGSRIILSRGMYRSIGEVASYTRYKGLDRNTNKELILRHIRDGGSSGASFKEFCEVLPALTSAQVHHLVNELRQEGRIRVVGWSRKARWLLVSRPVALSE